jgi:hypothetical protein
VTYTPAALYSGPDSFTFKANDGTVDSNIAAVSISVTHVNHAPVASAQTATTTEDVAKAIVLTASDVDGDTLTYAVVAGPAHGTLSGSAPNLTYTPAANYSGADSFSFKANDGTVDSNVATVTITVTPVNDPPIANAQSITTPQDSPLAIVLTASDLDGDALTYSVVAGPAHGSLSGTAPTLTYTPATLYSGADSFTFKANDGTADSNVATVSVTVTHVNHAPVASAQSVTTNEDTAKAIVLVATDVDNDPLTYAVVTAPLHGTLTGTAPNVTYTPAPNYSGTDAFSFKANDGVADSAPANVVITINAVNDAPSFVAGPNQSVAQDSGPQTVVAWATNISAGPIDESGQILNFIVSDSNSALFSVEPTILPNGTLSYTPAAGVSGSATITVQLHDNGGTANGGTDTSAPQTFVINVGSTKPGLSIANASAVEGNGGCVTTPMVFTVTLSSASAQAVSVNYQTLNGTASGDATCSATRSKGYITTTGTLTFAPGETTKTIIVPIVGDTAKEANQTLLVRLSNASTNATIIRSDAIGTIVDDDF